MQLKIIKDATGFKDNLIYLKEYFNSMMKRGVISPMYEDAYNPLKVTYDVVFNGEIMYSLQRKTSTFWPIRDSYIEGDDFLNSEIGKLYQEVIYYFSHTYKIPEDQMGGYNK